MTDSKTVVEDLAAWLTQIWDEEEVRELAKRTWRADAPTMDVTTDLDGGGVYVSNPGSSIQHWVSAEEYDRSYLTPAPDKQALARIAADRKILALHGDSDGYCDECGSGVPESGPGDPGSFDPVEWPCVTLRLLASPYADRPGFRPEWSVERQGVEW